MRILRVLPTPPATYLRPLLTLGGASLVLGLATFTTPAAARTAPGSTSGMTFATTAVEVENCVEQQSGGLQNCGSSAAVVNPTPCIWTVDQYKLDAATGQLPAGGSVSDQQCLIADGLMNWVGEPHWISVQASAPKNDIALSLSDQFGNVWPLAPTATKTGYGWSLCIPGPSFSSYPTIPNSNGGFGVEDQFTLRIRNTTSQVAKSLSAQFEVEGTTGPC
jgi:hypothetical protein